MRWTEITGPSGEPFDSKVEGLLVAPDATDRLFVVADEDDPDAPSSLLVVELRGPWQVNADAWVQRQDGTSDASTGKWSEGKRPSQLSGRMPCDCTVTGVDTRT